MTLLCMSLLVRSQALSCSGTGILADPIHI